jgi:CRP-like cAMP-binding protein
MDNTKIYIFEHESNTVTFKEGETIFRKGDPATQAYVVQSGEVAILLNEHHTEIMESGDLFGEMALISREPRSATAVARTDVKLVPIDEKRFLFMVSETPNFALTVMRAMAQRLRNENEEKAALKAQISTD